MNREGALGLLLIALLFGGVLLLARRSPVTSYPNTPREHSQGVNIRAVAISEPAHYKNKETRRIEYNSDGLPSLIEITRDYAIA